MRTALKNWAKRHFVVYGTITFLLGSISGFYFNEYASMILPVPFKPQPEIVLQLTEIEYWNDWLGKSVENSVIYFLVHDQRGFLVEADEGDQNISNKIQTFSFEFPLQSQPNENQYILFVKNTGTAPAKNVSIDLSAEKGIRIVDPDRKLLMNNCSSAPNNGCYLEITVLAPGEIARLNVIGEKPGIKKASAKIDGEDKNILINKKYFSVMPYSGWDFTFNDKVIPLPDAGTNALYYLDTEKSTWVLSSNFEDE